MAETKNSAPAKFDKDALKEWFNLAEVADRWTRLTGQTITTNDLLQFGESGKLEICFNFTQARVQWGFYKDDATSPTPDYYFVPVTDNESWTGLFKLDEQGIRIAKNGTGMPAVLHWPRGRLFTGRLLELIRGGDSSISGDDAMLGSLYRGAVDINGTEQINLAGLVITRSELERFEKENRVNQLEITPEHTEKEIGAYNPEHSTSQQDIKPEIPVARAEQYSTKKPLKSEKQIDAIMKIIEIKGYNPLKIPDGEKQVIKTIVLAEDDCDLFDKKNSFNNAWKKATYENLIRMENHDSWSRRGD